MELSVSVHFNSFGCYAKYFKMIFEIRLFGKIFRLDRIVDTKTFKLFFIQWNKRNDDNVKGIMASVKGWLATLMLVSIWFGASSPAPTRLLVVFSCHFSAILAMHVSFIRPLGKCLVSATNLKKNQKSVKRLREKPNQSYRKLDIEVSKAEVWFNDVVVGKNVPCFAWKKKWKFKSQKKIITKIVYLLIINSPF